jgi:Protein of unknown function DUF262
VDFGSTEQIISWFRDRYREGTLQIRPPFQRKPVWAARQKSYLIESILLGLPVPEVYIQQVVTDEGDTTYAVVDGQQRIRTVLQFVGVEDDPEQQQFSKFALDKLPPDSRWYNVTFTELSAEEKRAFYGYKFAVRTLNTNNDEDVRDMFRRLNKFLTPLNAQELRNAIYTGPFIRLVESLADNPYWAENKVVTATQIRRMVDLQFVSELLIGVMHGPQGGSQKIVDEYYEQYEDSEPEFPGQKRARLRFVETLRTIESILPRLRETRWSNLADFYSLFVALAATLREREITHLGDERLGHALMRFALDVDTKLEDPDAEVARRVSVYSNNVQRGANDRVRRGERHRVLLREINAALD